MKIIFNIYIFIFICLLSQSALARKNIDSFDNIIIVGDSLSDQSRMGLGRIPYCPNPAAGYWNNRFTNGKLWVDYLVEDQGEAFRVKIKNLAVGGTALTKRGAGGFAYPIMQQIVLAKEGRKKKNSDEWEYTPLDFSRSMFIIFGGSNDIKDYIDNGKWVATEPEELGFAMAFAIKEMQDYIVRNGGSLDNILIIGLPPLHKIPKAKDWTQAQRDWAQQTVTQAANHTQLFAGNSLYLDISLRISEIIDGTKVYYGLTDVKNTCSSVAQCTLQATSEILTGGPYQKKTCESYLFFDQVHPTSLAHCGINKWIAQELNKRFDVAGFKAGDNIDHNINSCGLERQIPQATWKTRGTTLLFGFFDNSSEREPIVYTTEGSDNPDMAVKASYCRYQCNIPTPTSSFCFLSLGTVLYPNGANRSFCRCGRN